MWDKERIQSLLLKSDEAVIRAVQAIQSRQTDTERATGKTQQTNGIGWSKFDAPWMAEMLAGFAKWGRLTPKQMAITRNKVMRYHRQLVEIAMEKEAAKTAISTASIESIEGLETSPEEAEFEHQVAAPMRRAAETVAFAGVFS